MELEVIIGVLVGIASMNAMRPLADKIYRERVIGLDKYKFKRIYPSSFQYLQCGIGTAICPDHSYTSIQVSDTCRDEAVQADGNVSAFEFYLADRKLFIVRKGE